MRIKTPTIRDYAEFNRRDFLRQVSCAFAVAGVACTIPAHVHAEEPAVDPGVREHKAGSWTKISVPSKVCAMRLFDGGKSLAIITEDGQLMVLYSDFQKIENFRAVGCDVELLVRKKEYIELCAERDGVALQLSSPELVVCNDGMTYRMESGEWHG